MFVGTYSPNAECEKSTISQHTQPPEPSLHSRYTGLNEVEASSVEANK
ncbi:hypothetical protein [Bacteroides clarus]|nr:hypothetical protein [Bacteroides clarus]